MITLDNEHLEMLHGIHSKMNYGHGGIEYRESEWDYNIYICYILLFSSVTCVFEKRSEKMTDSCSIIL